MCCVCVVCVCVCVYLHCTTQGGRGSLELVGVFDDVHHDDHCADDGQRAAQNNKHHRQQTVSAAPLQVCSLHVEQPWHDVTTQGRRCCAQQTKHLGFLVVVVAKERVHVSVCE